MEKEIQFRKNFIWNILGTGFNAFNSLFFMIAVTRINGVDNAAHIGGLIGGVLVSMMAGVKYKSSTMEKVNGLILTIIFTLFLIYLGFFRQV